MKAGLRFLFLCPLFLAGCFPKPGDISGNVFVADKLGQAKKLPLVPIGLYREADIREAVGKSGETLQLKMKEARSRLASTGQRCDQLKKERASREEALGKLEERLDGLEKTRPKNPKYYKPADTEVFTSTVKVSDPFSINPPPAKKTANQDREERERREQEVYELMAQKWRGEYDQTKESRDREEEGLQRVGGELATLEAEMSTLIQFLGVRWKETFFEILSQRLPSPAVSTKTDADGNFVLPSPPKGKLVISARYVGEGENLIWLLHLPEKPPGDGRILLNNDNLLSAEPTNAVFRFRGD
jgi:hypothetical protein